MLNSLAFWLVVLAALIAYLGVSMRARGKSIARAEEARLHAIEQEHPPRAFDASAIAPQIERVRQNHAALAHKRWRPSYHRAGLFAAARRLVTDLAYFRRSRHEPDLHKLGA